MVTAKTTDHREAKLNILWVIGTLVTKPEPTEKLVSFTGVCIRAYGWAPVAPLSGAAQVDFATIS